MIWMELTGGLGNQLFIWSAAHEVSNKYSTKVCLFYVHNSSSRVDRPVEIANLIQNCSHEILLKQSKSLGMLIRFIDYLSRFPSSRRLFVHLLRFDDYPSPFATIQLKTRAPRVIRGFFQSDLMVESSRTDIENEITSEISLHLKKLSLKEMELHNKTVCHIRRGDTIELRNSVGLLSRDYYETILIDDRNIVIFSESVEIKKEFNSFPSNTVFYTGDNMSAWESLSAMSCATKLVIANSTLSWWAAKIAIWDHEATVFMPNPWMRSLTSNQGLTLNLAIVKDAIYVK